MATFDYLNYINTFDPSKYDKYDFGVTYGANYGQDDSSDPNDFVRNYDVATTAYNSLQGLRSAFESGDLNSYATAQTAFKDNLLKYYNRDYLADPNLEKVLSGSVFAYQDLARKAVDRRYISEYGSIPTEGPLAIQYQQEWAAAGDRSPFEEANSASKEASRAENAIDAERQANYTPSEPTPAGQPGSVQGQPGQTGQTSGQQQMSGTITRDMNDNFFYNGQHIDLPTFQSLGINADFVPRGASVSLQEAVSGSGGYASGGYDSGLQQSGQPGQTQPGQSGQTGMQPQQTPSDFMSTYSQVIKDLGLSDIKKRFEDVNKQFGNLQNELNDKIADINDNPWLTEGIRVSQIRKLQERYEGKFAILTGQMDIYDSLYKEGVAQARYVTDGIIDDRNVMFTLAQKKEEAMMKLLETDPNQFKSVQGGLFDIQNYEWVVPPTDPEADIRSVGGDLVQVNPDGSVSVIYRSPDSGGGSGGASSKFKTRLAQVVDDVYAGRYSREQAVGVLQSEYPGMDVNEIARFVYTQVPDSFESTSAFKGDDGGNIDLIIDSYLNTPL